MIGPGSSRKRTMWESVRELSIEVRWATLPNHQRPLRVLYQRCAPAGRVEELNRLSQRLRGTRLYPGTRNISPRDRDSSRCAALMRIWR